MQKLELDKLELESIAWVEAQETNGGTSLAYDIGRGIRFFCYYTAGYISGGQHVGTMLAVSDFKVNQK